MADYVVLTIPLKEGFTDCPIYQVQIDKWKKEYPEIDVLQTLKADTQADCLHKLYYVYCKFSLLIPSHLPQTWRGDPAFN